MTEAWNQQPFMTRPPWTRLELCDSHPQRCRATFLACAFQWTARMIHDAEDDQVEAVRHHKRDRGKNHRPTGERVRCIVTARPQELASGPETRLKRRWREVADSASAPAERDASRSGSASA